ncbi:MAG: hypothetical protein AB8F74_12015, partial [Saprospiraceae bacterium]
MSELGTGIIIRNLATNTETTIPNSLSYDASQIELASNNRMYFVADHDDIGEYDLLTSTYSADAIPNLGSNSALLFSGPQTDPFWTLPDQIDGFDYQSLYNNTTPECCSAVAPYEIITLDVNTGTSNSWSDTNNPFGNSAIIRVQNEIRVSNSSDLTITDLEIQFAENARIIVEEGSTLTINRTTLTSNDCESTWRGITVLGDPSASQSTPNAHGSVRLRDAIIEHADIAVNVGSQTNVFQRGGMLTVTGDNTQIRNNRIGFKFDPYSNDA